MKDKTDAIPRASTINFLRFPILTFIGLANSLTIPLSGSVLSIWLSEIGFTKDTIGLFALLGLPFCFKIMWSPIIDHVALPFCENCPRKGWVAFALIGIAACLMLIGSIDSAQSPWILVFSLFCLSTFCSCLYISGLGYELESIPENDYSVGSACVITGYRIGLLCAGAGGLYLAYLWGWFWMYAAMALVILAGCIVVLFNPEPYKSAAVLQAKREEFASHTSLFKGFWQATLMQPFRLFFQQSNWVKVLIMILGFKCSDHLAKSMEGLFYISLGFNKADLALVAKVWGFACTILGAFLSGLWIRGKDPFWTAAVMGCLHTATLFFNCILSVIGKSYFGLCVTVAAENLTGSMAMTAFIYMLWKVCDKRYAAVQYALFWSLFSFKGSLLACLGGILAATCSWPLFFLVVGTFSTAVSLSLLLYVPAPVVNKDLSY